MVIHQEVIIDCEPSQLYRLLTNSKEFSKVTGSKAELSGENGAAFACFDGKISGRNLELQPDAMIVQAWRVDGWPEGIYSVVRMTIEKNGSATRLVLHHSAFPDGEKDHLEDGWHKMYWTPLKSACK